MKARTRMGGSVEKKEKASTVIVELTSLEECRWASCGGTICLWLWRWEKSPSHQTNFLQFAKSFGVPFTEKDGRYVLEGCRTPKEVDEDTGKGVFQFPRWVISVIAWGVLKKVSLQYLFRNGPKSA